MTIRGLALMSGLVLPACPGAAFELAFPVDCVLGESCYFQNLFDHDPGPEARDAGCGPLAYDGHDGTDIALPTLADQRRGVNVLAAAPGVVTGLRDGAEDILQGSPDAPDVTGRECGNGVILRHEGGWETQYCHMAAGSLTVAEGDEVAAGDVLGQVGLSGWTEFPHVELAVRHDGEPLDPFAPDLGANCGQPLDGGLWAEPLPLPEGGLTVAGFANAIPDYAAVRAGTADVPPAPEQPLVLFGLVYGGRAGDQVRLSIIAPNGDPVLAHSEPLDRTQALLFRAAGLRPPEGGWRPGAYRGRVTLLREGEEIGSLAATVEMPPR